MTHRLRPARSRLASALRPVAARPNLRRTAAATFLAWSAEWAFVVALLVYAYQVGGVLAVGLVGMARTAPAALAAPLISGALDGVPRHRVLAFVHLLRGGIVGTIAVSALGEPAEALIYVLAAAEGIVAVIHRPTVMALMPGLVRDPGELVAGNAALSIVEGIATLVAPAVGGVVIASAGAPAALALPALAFAGAFLLILGVRPAPVRRGAVAGPMRLLRDGLRAVTGRPHVRLIFALIAAQTFVRGALMVLLLDASVRLLGLGEAGVGYLSSAIGAGGLLGAISVAATLTGRGLGGPTRLGLALWGLPIVGMGLLPAAPVAFPLMVVIGVGNAIFDVAIFTLLQRTVPNALRGRVLGLLEAVIMLSVGLGSVAAPQLLLALDLRVSLLAVGLLLPILAVLARRGLAEAEEAIVIPAHRLELLRGVPAFGPLPLTILEQLAEDLDEVAFGAGTPIVVQHAAGDAFYILSAGRARVTVDGRAVAVLGPGDSFGEVALLRDVPRTATVTATEPMRGFSLSRESFLAAVASERLSWQAAEAVAASYVTGDDAAR